MKDERRLIPLSGIKPEVVRWLWPNRLLIGAVNLLEGDPGVGKSALTFDLAARVTRGAPMPNCQGRTAPAGAVLVGTEDPLASKVLPSLQAAGANLDLVYAYDSRSCGDRPLVLPEDLGLIEAAAASIKARLVVIDPLAAVLSGPLHSEKSVRQVLGPLAAFADRAGLAVLVLRHLAKTASSSSVIYRGAGSIALSTSPRSVLRVVRHPAAGDRRHHVVVQVKSNHADAVSLTYRTIKRGDAITVEWGEPIPYTADDLADSEADDPSALWQAGYFLYTVLRDGPVPAKEVERQAREAGVSRRTLQRAKRALRIQSPKRGGGSGSYWLWALGDDEELIRPFKEKFFEDLTDQLLHDGEGPPLPGDEWKGGRNEDDDGPAQPRS